MRSKIFFAFVLSLIASCLSLHAQTVSPEAARAKAMDFFSTGAKNLPARKGAMRKAPAVSNVELAYTSEKDGKTCFYVYNNGTDGGFVIVGGDEVAQEILAYVPQGHFDYEKAPDNLKWWLGQYEQEISVAKEAIQQPLSKSNDASSKDSQSNLQDIHSFFTDIPSMITTKWGQWAPYNTAIPIPSNEEESAATGCVATALAQVMNYWEYPSKGVSNRSYEWDYGNNQIMTYSADFGNTTYDWDNMLDDYRQGEPTQVQIDAVSTLMYHVGVAVQTVYSSYASSVTSNHIHRMNTEIVGLLRYFNYDLKARAVRRDDITDEDWESIIYTELKAGRPVYYSGQGDAGGHAFICDGYSSTLNMFSFNWGWDGSDDGYYSLCGTNVANGFTKDQEIITHLQPANRAEQNIAQYNDHIVVDDLHYIILNPYLKRVALTNSNLEGDIIYSGDVVVPESIVYNGDTYTVTQIDEDAFQVIVYPDGRDWYPSGNGCDVKSVTLPESVRRIGHFAFMSCRELETVNLPEMLENIPPSCFNECYSLGSIDLGSSITKIGYSAFGSCTSISNIVIPGTALKEVGPFAFQNCTNLVSIDLPSSLESIDVFAFDQTNLVQMICRSATVPVVGSLTFQGAPINDGTLYVPKVAIDDYKSEDWWNYWKNWGQIKTLDQMSSNDYLGVKFSDNGLMFMLLGDNIATVCGYDSLGEELVIPGRVYYDGIPFDVVSISPEVFMWSKIKTLKISEGIKKIGRSAFQYCKNLVEVELPESLEKMEDYVFYNDEKLKHVIIPGSVKTVKGFCGCTDLEEVLIGEGAEQIEPYCFQGCTSLRKVVVPSTMLLLGGGCFYDCDSIEEFVSFSPNIYNCRADYSYIIDDLKITDFSFSGSASDSVDFRMDPIHGTLYVNEENIDYYRNNSNWKRWENIQPLVTCSSVQLVNSENVISINDKLHISPLFEPTNTTCKQLTWYSSDPTIATVDQDGVVTARKLGTVTITATSMYYPDVTATCTVTVKAGTVGTLVDAIDGLPSGRTTLQDVDDAVDSILER